MILISIAFGVVGWVLWFVGSSAAKNRHRQLVERADNSDTQLEALQATVRDIADSLRASETNAPLAELLEDAAAAPGEDFNPRILRIAEWARAEVRRRTAREEARRRSAPVQYSKRFESEEDFRSTAEAFRAATGHDLNSEIEMMRFYPAAGLGYVSARSDVVDAYLRDADWRIVPPLELDPNEVTDAIAWWGMELRGIRGGFGVMPTAPFPHDHVRMDVTLEHETQRIASLVVLATIRDNWPFPKAVFYRGARDEVDSKVGRWLAEHRVARAGL